MSPLLWAPTLPLPILLILLAVGCWFVWDLGQICAEIIVEQLRALNRWITEVDAAIELADRLAAAGPLDRSGRRL